MYNTPTLLRKQLGKRQLCNLKGLGFNMQHMPTNTQPGQPSSCNACNGFTAAPPSTTGQSDCKLRSCQDQYLQALCVNKPTLLQRIDASVTSLVHAPGQSQRVKSTTEVAQVGSLLAAKKQHPARCYIHQQQHPASTQEHACNECKPCCTHLPPQ